jgi:predicted dehydrogenase
MTTSSRRAFLASGAVTVSSAALSADTTPAVPVAVIGCGGMGTNHLKMLATNKRVKLAAVCDVDSTRLANAAKIATDAGHAPKATKDLREVLDNKDVKAVWIATPDHWHAPAAILAADAGKHVYVEKPCSHNVREGRLMIAAAARGKVLMQVGTQSRSTPTVQEAMARLRGGAIGDVLVAKAWNSQRRKDLGHVKPTAPPDHLDFDLWLGPAPEAPFYANRVHSSWRFFRDYGVGDIGNDGVHNIDVALWGLGATTLPNRVAALGGKYAFDDDQECPDTQYVVCEFDKLVGKPRQLIFEQRIWSPYVQEEYENGNAFYGTKGMLIIGHTIGWKLYGEKNQLKEQMTGKVNLPAHHDNFLDAMLKGDKPNAPVEVGHAAAGVCHLANIATRLRTTVEFDPATEVIANSKEANALTRRKYRETHWAVPKGV